jgi:hypothetical protein
MKKQRLYFIILAVMVSTVFFGCEDLAELAHGPKPEPPPVTYTVAFNANGATGNAPETQTVNANTIITLPGKGGLTSAGNIFIGWTENGITYSVGDTITVTRNMVFYAQWVDASTPQYTVIFNANGATGAPPASKIVYSGVQTILPNQGTLAYSGKTFGGWNTNADGDGTNYSAGFSYTVTANVTLYAKWQSDIQYGVGVTSVTLNQSTLTLIVGHTAYLTVTVSPTNATNKAVTWTSSNNNVATVNNGTITAVAAGSATITVITADGGKTATCSIMVTAASPGIIGEEVELVNLQALIKDAPLGVIGNWSSSVFGGTPFVECFSPTFTIIYEGGKKKLKIDNMQSNNGDGIDIRNVASTDGNTGVGFKAGDVVVLKATINPVGNGLRLTNGSSSDIATLFDWNGGASIDEIFTLTDTEIAIIKGSNPQTLRIAYGGPEGNGRKGTIIIEELIVKGLRAEGEIPKTPLVYDIVGSGTYTVPPPSGNDIFIDLNTALIGQLTPAEHFPDARIDTTGLTVTFDWNTQNIFIPFTDEIKTLIVSAAKDSYTFDVVITGTGTGNIRWCFGADRTGNWNVTDPREEGAFNTILTSIQAVRNDRSPNDLNGIVLQARPAGNEVITSAITPPYTITISKIKVTLNAP